MKLFKCLLSIAAGLALLSVASSPMIEKVEAVSSYDYRMQCDAYEVDTINDDGSFSSKGCYASFDSAKSVMKESGDNAVVRHDSSLSPTKIIAMNYGTAYSYPCRESTTSTVTIDQYYPSVTNMKTTYMTKHREMYYYDTVYYDGAGGGMVHVMVNGFDGYISLKSIDLVPLKYTTNGIALYLGGNDITADNEQPFLVSPCQSYYSVVKNGNYTDLVFTWSSGWASATTPVSYSYAIGPAASWMSTGDKYYSYDGTTFYADAACTQQVGTYYSYYEFLPLRSASDISADKYNGFLSAKGYNSSSKLWDTGSIFVSAQNEYGINALLVFSMACLESAYGTSTYAVERNNLFGWNAIDSDPDQASYFSSVEQAIKEHMGINLRCYDDINDYRFFGSQLGNKGSGLNVKYAADPYWGTKIAAIAYEFDKYANDYNGNYTDTNAYDLGVVTTYNAEAKQSDSSSSKTLYNTAYGATYQKNFMITVLGSSNGYIKTNSTNPISSSAILGGSTYSSQYLSYDLNSNFVYYANDDVTVFDSSIIIDDPEVPEGDPVYSGELYWKDNSLMISGSSYRPGIVVSDTNTADVYLTLTSSDFEDTYFELENTINKDVITFDSDIDISSLEDGSYYFTVSTEYSETSDYNLYNVVKQEALESKTINNRVYSFETKEDALWLTVKTIEESQEEEKTEDPGDAYVLLNSITDSNGVITLSGIGFISGMNASSDANVTHTLVLTDLSTEEEIVIPCTTENGASINMGDGYDYTRSKFKGSISIDDLIAQSEEEANYYIKLIIHNGDVEKTIILNNKMNKTLPSAVVEDDTTICITANSIYNYRLEINLNQYGLEVNSISKPTARNSFISGTLTLNDDLTLTLSGAAWIYNINYTDLSELNYTLLEVSAEDKQVETLSAKACSINYSELLGLSYDYSNACFEGSSDLSTLENGIYVLELDLSYDDYRDIYEISNISGKTDEQIVTSEDRKYTLKRTDLRNRYTLTIEDLD